LPDFAPTNASLIEGGTVLRITISNRTGGAFSGAMVVAVSDVPVESPQLAFQVRIAGNGSTTVDFRLTTPVTQQSRARVRLDPANAIAEVTKDNNEANFVLAPPVEAPRIAMQAVIDGSIIRVTISNSGADVNATGAVVRMRTTVGGVNQTIERPLALMLPRGGAASVELPKPSGPSTATIDLLINGQPVAEAQVNVPPS
jgi:hypothetical protein